jgi:putative hemolysin
MHSPERIASFLAAPMSALARAASPLVKLLSASTDGLLRLFGVSPISTDQVTEEEVRAMVEQGAESGVFEETEQKIVERVFRLSDRVVGELMVPRTEIDWLPADASPDRVRVAVATSPHSHFPVCKGGLDGLIGVVHVKDLVKSGLLTERVDLAELIQPPLYVPESLAALRALETFREARTHLAFVTDEYGGLVGLITLNDLVESIVGEVTSVSEGEEPMTVRRADGSWLLDGLLPVDHLRELMEVRKLPKEDEAEYATVGGLVMAYLGRIPRAGDRFEWDRFTFEVMDMDRQRVDKVLLSFRPEPGAPQQSPG